MFAEWLNGNYRLKATTGLTNHLKDLEVKLPISLGKGQAARERREAWVTSHAQVLSAKICSICNAVYLCRVHLSMVSPVWVHKG